MVGWGDDIEEVSIVFDAFGAQPGTMLDVGAHWGYSLAPFLASGWTVYAFEPDPSNREVLLSQFPGAIVDPRAVSEEDGETVTLFKSEVSTGISTLSPFHPSHRAGPTVRTVRLDTYMHDKGIEHVDFVKTDVEGLDLFALRTFPWENCHPKAVVCEFEDNKTKRLGYTARDLAEFLMEKGYAVVVSEWEPVVQYGTRQSWRKFTRYPSEIPTEIYGNLIAVEPALLSELEWACDAAAKRMRMRKRLARILRV